MKGRLFFHCGGSYVVMASFLCRSSLSKIEVSVSVLFLGQNMHKSCEMQESVSILNGC